MLQPVALGAPPRQDIVKHGCNDQQRRENTDADAVVAVTGPAINANNENNRVVSAVLCSALYPNIVKVLLSGRSSDHNIFKGFDTGAEVHANSNRSNGKTSESGGFEIQNCC